MGYNVLSGSVSSVSGFIGSGSFTGSFGGDGTNLENVKQFDLYGQTTAGTIPYYKSVSGEIQLEGDSTFTFNSNTDTLSLSRLSASSGMNFTGLVQGTTATTSSVLGLDSNNNVVLTQGGAITALNNKATNRLVTIGSATTDLDGEANLTFDGNTLNLVGQVNISSSTNAITVTGSIIPSGSGVYNLGSPSNRFSAVYLSTGSVHLGDNCSISSNEETGHIVVNKPFLVEGTLTSSNGVLFNGAGGTTLRFDGNVLNVQSGLILKRRQISSTITASATDYFIGISASANLDIRLPDASALSSGQALIFKDENGTAGIHTILILASGSQKIDDYPSIKLESPFAAVNIYSNGSNKYFIF